MQFDRLLSEAASRLPRLKAVIADKAYSDWDVLASCRKHNVRMVVPPKVGMTALRHELDLENLHDSNPSEFQELYRFRSAVESVFWGTKSYGQFLSTRERSDSDVLPEGICIAQATEIVARFTAYNLRRLVQFEHLLGQRISFYPASYFAPIDPERVIDGRSMLDGQFPNYGAA